MTVKYSVVDTHIQLKEVFDSFLKLWSKKLDHKVPMGQCIIQKKNQNFILIVIRDT